MNGALLSSKNMGWCTPADFFSELDQEFHFNLDPAATDKSAKCARYFTPADDGLISIHALRVEGDSKNGQSFRLFLRKREKNLPF